MACCPGPASGPARPAISRAPARHRPSVAPSGNGGRWRPAVQPPPAHGPAPPATGAARSGGRCARRRRSRLHWHGCRPARIGPGSPARNLARAAWPGAAKWPAAGRAPGGCGAGRSAARPSPASDPALVRGAAPRGAPGPRRLPDRLAAPAHSDPAPCGRGRARTGRQRSPGCQRPAFAAPGGCGSGPVPGPGCHRPGGGGYRPARR